LLTISLAHEKCGLEPPKDEHSSCGGGHHHHNEEDSRMKQYETALQALDRFYAKYNEKEYKLSY